MGQSPLAFLTQNYAGGFRGGRTDQQGGLMVSQRGGKHYISTYGTPAIAPAAAIAGSVFRGSNQSAASTTVALATTYTGLCLSNPAASTVNLVVKRALWAITSSSVLSLGFITGWATAGVVTHTTPVTQIINGYVGAATSAGSAAMVAPQGLLDAACTLVGTPAWDRWVSGTPTTTTAGGTFDFEDDTIVPPGGYIAFGTLLVTTGFLGTFMWEEKAP